MTIDLDSFLRALDSALSEPIVDNAKKYVSVEPNGKNYKIHAKKNEKNLNTARINELFQKASVEFKDNSEKLTKLSETIGKYKARLDNRSKPWYYRLFGLSSGEKELVKIKSSVDVSLKKAEAVFGRSIPKVQAFESLPAPSLKGRISLLPPSSPNPVYVADVEESQRKRKRGVDSELKRDKEIITKMKLFDSVNIDWKAPGTSQELGLKTYIDDLQAFVVSDKFNRLSDVQKTRIRRTLHELVFAFEITILRALYDSEQNPQRKQIILDKINDEIQKELSNLRAPSDCVLLPGGYLNPDSKGHAVLYMIKKVDEGHSSLTIINTGEAAMDIGRISLTDISGKISLLSAGKNIGNYLKEGFLEFAEVLNLRSLPRSKCIDVTYTNLPTSGLSNKFFSTLVVTLHKRAEVTEMEKVITEVEGILPRENGRHGNPSPLKKIEGRVHKMQNNGVCAVKSVSSFIHERLDEVKVYWTFKFFSSEIVQSIVEKGKGKLIEIGRQIVEKRGRKAREEERGKERELKATVQQSKNKTKLR